MLNLNKSKQNKRNGLIRRLGRGFIGMTGEAGVAANDGEDSHSPLVATVDLLGAPFGPLTIFLALEVVEEHVGHVRITGTPSGNQDQDWYGGLGTCLLDERWVAPIVKSFDELSKGMWHSHCVSASDVTEPSATVKRTPGTQ